ncbi:MAG: winged helix-turn-helix domain-containing protein [Acidobacteriota bacterium]
MPNYRFSEHHPKSEGRGGGAFELDIDRGELLWHGEEETRSVHVPPQPFRVLEYLLGRPGHLVTRQELGCVLWADEVFVDQDLGLNHCIRRLRRVLGDDAQSPGYIQTVPRRGYRFIADVDLQTEDEAPHGGVETVDTEDSAAVGGLRIAVLPFASYSPGLIDTCFADSLAEEVLREAFRVVSPHERVQALHRLESGSLSADVTPDLVLTGSARYEAGLLRILGYLIHGHDGAVLRTLVWQLEVEEIGLETQMQAARALVEDLLRVLPTAPVLGTTPESEVADRPSVV